MTLPDVPEVALFESPPDAPLELLAVLLRLVKTKGTTMATTITEMRQKRPAMRSHGRVLFGASEP